MEKLIETVGMYIGTVTVFISYNNSDICNFNIVNPVVNETDTEIIIIGENDESVSIYRNEIGEWDTDGLSNIFVATKDGVKKSLTFLD